MTLRYGILKLNFPLKRYISSRNSSLKAEIQYNIPEERKISINNENIDLQGNLSEKKIVKRMYIKKPELIIFDKDGTLICFHAMWVPWIVGYVEGIEKMCGKRLSTTLYKKLGFCMEMKKVTPGLLAEGTMKQISDTSLNVLKDYGIPNEESYKIIQNISKIMSEEQKSSRLIKEITNIHTLFTNLKNDNIKIGVCTSDSRKNTIQTLSFLGVKHLIDFISCGDDVGSIPKPDPSNALKICTHLNVPPSKTIMVGDTLTDLKMAHLANLYGGVGVLSGVGNYSLLRPYSKLMVNDVSQIPLHFK